MDFLGINTQVLIFSFQRTPAQLPALNPRSCRDSRKPSAQFRSPGGLRCMRPVCGVLPPYSVGWQVWLSTSCLRMFVYECYLLLEICIKRKRVGRGKREGVALIPFYKLSFLFFSSMSYARITCAGWRSGVQSFGWMRSLTLISHPTPTLEVLGIIPSLFVILFILPKAFPLGRVPGLSQGLEKLGGWRFSLESDFYFCGFLCISELSTFRIRTRCIFLQILSKNEKMTWAQLFLLWAPAAEWPHNSDPHKDIAKRRNASLATKPGAF